MTTLSGSRTITSCCIDVKENLQCSSSGGPKTCCFLSPADPLFQHQAAVRPCPLLTAWLP